MRSGTARGGCGDRMGAEGLCRAAGIWVGVKVELSLASANPQRGFALARDSLGRIFLGGWRRRLGLRGGGRDGARDAEVRGRGEGVGWRASSSGRGRFQNRPLRKMGNKRERRRGVRGARSRRRRVSIEHGWSGGWTWDRVFLVYTKWLRRARGEGKE